MSHARWTAVESAFEGATETLLLEPESAALGERLQEAEFRLMLEAAALRILDLVPDGVGEQGPDEP